MLGIGALFGAMIGLISAVATRVIKQLRLSSEITRWKLIRTFTLLSALIGGLLFVPFSEGISMAIYLWFEGLLAGAIIGVLVGIIIPRSFLQKNQ